VTPANQHGPICPQNQNTGLTFVPLNSTGSSEDCLFLNVYAPANASGLPVLVWIHGGGYGRGNGRQDLSALINANNDAFVGVSIQYRVSEGITETYRTLLLIDKSLEPLVFLPVMRFTAREALMQGCLTNISVFNGYNITCISLGVIPPKSRSLDNRLVVEPSCYKAWHTVAL